MLFLPEYSITPHILKSISIAEYARAVIENTTILSTWEKQLQKEAQIKFVHGSLLLSGLSTDAEKIKKYLDKVEKSNLPQAQQINNLIEASSFAQEISGKAELDENDLNNLQKYLLGDERTSYRTSRIPGKTPPEEILAKIVQLFDWYNSLDAKETHPLVTAAILKAQLDIIKPFQTLNEVASNLFAEISLKSKKYAFKNYLCVEEYFIETGREYNIAINTLAPNQTDFTHWINYFCEGMAHQASVSQEKIKLLSRDTKVAKATGRVRISPRQERIVEFLQDYGIMQNKDFPMIFPGISQDSILRDLKSLIEKGIIQKTGSTKSSKYELS